MANKISISFPFESLEEFENSQKRIFREVLVERTQGNISNISNSEYLTRKQVSEKLHLSLPTIDVLMKTGIIKGYKIRGRVLFKSSDVDSALEPIEAIKYKRGE
jgi:excisionase family DNA binding protein